MDEEIPVDAEPLDAEQAVKLALDRRPELRTAISSISESERSILAARSQLRPQVDVGVAVTRQQTVNQLGSAFGLNDFRVATLATINAPIDRTVEAVALQTALIERAQRQRDLEALRDRVTLEARQSARRQERALRSLTLARSSVELAEKKWRWPALASSSDCRTTSISSMLKERFAVPRARKWSHGPRSPWRVSRRERHGSPRSTPGHQMMRLGPLMTARNAAVAGA